jgi:hypothetical protein
MMTISPVGSLMPCLIAAPLPGYAHGKLLFDFSLYFISSFFSRSISRKIINDYGLLVVIRRTSDGINIGVYVFSALKHGMITESFIFIMK